MPTLLTHLRPWIEPIVGAVFFSLWCVAEAGRYQGGPEIVALGVLTVSIAISRFQPAIALALVAILVGLHVTEVFPPVGSTTWPVAFGALLVVFVVALEASRALLFVALVLGLPLATAAGYLAHNGQIYVGADRVDGAVDVFLPTLVISLGLYVGAWAIGYALRVNMRELRALLLLRTTTAQLDGIASELAVTQERDRIARDVHDVLAHSLAVVVAQADGARFASAARPEITDAAFRAIADAARSALVDVRTLIEGMRDEPGDHPQPGLADIPTLVSQMSGAGMRTDAQHFGEAKPMTPSQQLAVFRIIQESLTNGLRHAGRHAATRLSFDWRGPGLALTVSSSGDGRADLPVPTGGHGIRGMKDRARLVGGWLTAGESDDPPGFIVTAYIPTAPEPAPSTALELAQ
jgi:signal transduction histidine kinase